MKQILARIADRPWLFAGLAAILVGILLEQTLTSGWPHWLSLLLMLGGSLIVGKASRGRSGSSTRKGLATKVGLFGALLAMVGIGVLVFSGVPEPWTTIATGVMFILLFGAIFIAARRERQADIEPF